MATLQKSASFSLMGTLAASCFLLIALSVQGGAAGPIRSHCRLDKSNFQRPYITNHTFMLASEASLADNNTDVRLIGEKLFHGVNMSERCYLMKQVLNFTVEEVLLPQSDRFQPYMQEVVPFLARLSNELSQCHIQRDDQHIRRNVQQLRDTVEKSTLRRIKRSGGQWTAIWWKPVYISTVNGTAMWPVGEKNNCRRLRLAIVTHPKTRGMISGSESDALASSLERAARLKQLEN